MFISVILYVSRVTTEYSSVFIMLFSMYHVSLLSLNCVYHVVLYVSRVTTESLVCLSCCSPCITCHY